VASPTDLVRLTIVPDETEAEVLRGLLAAEGIQSMQRQTDFAAGAWDGWAVAGAREILVHAGDLERARELLPEK
jgi:Putative prokaryotic signal transducing protein